MQTSKYRELTKDESKMVEANVKLVYKIAHTFPFKKDFDDIVGEGMLALIFAVQRYKPEMGFTFGTYAYAYIRGRIQSFLNKNKVVRPVRKGTTYEQPIICEYDEAAAQINYQDENDALLIKTQASMIIAAAQGIDRVIIEKFIEGYTKKEIAVMLNMPRETVYRIFRKFVKQQKEVAAYV